MREPKAPPALYETDFVLWLEEQSRALRARRFADLDVPNLIEEVEGLANRDRRELRSRIEVVLTHLLKLARQPQRASRSWRSTLYTQRGELAGLLRQSPSLRRLVPEVMRDAYKRARQIAAVEIGCSPKAFAEDCPFAVADVLHDAELSNQS